MYEVAKPHIVYKVLHFFRERENSWLIKFNILPNTIQILNTARISKLMGVMISDSLVSEPLYPRKMETDTL